jgi:ADP-ribosylglycohydrolase
MPLPPDYEERVYAGVLGKIIGVYLGRPFEGWTYEQIMAELGEINYYVHDRLNVPLVVTDDDISGTFTFLRALPDYNNSRDLTPAQIGQTWLNYIIEGETILWWGGMGNSTEHTAYLRLKNGIPAPESGSMRLNSRVVAEQIGAQIFIDGWAMVAPGDPELAAELARRAGSVSHDGEAIYGAQVIAAMESLAFVEADTNKLLDSAVALIPADSLVYGLIAELRDFRAGEDDWRKARAWIAANYGYDKFGGNCHIIPNHALIIHALLYGDDNFHKSLMIVNTCGWDTDCNSGNVGCLLGIKNGLAGIDSGPDWRGPLADRLYLPTADGGGAITDALTEAYRVVNIGWALAGLESVAPKRGARFHFEMPGSMQGFQPDDSPQTAGTVWLENVEGHSRYGEHSLALHYRGVTRGRQGRIAAPTFIPSKQVASYFERGYRLLASPTLYSGQMVRAGIAADERNDAPITCGLYIQVYDAGDEKVIVNGSQVAIPPGQYCEIDWTIPDTGGAPIAEIGLSVSSAAYKRRDGTLFLDYLTWDGAPTITLKRPDFPGVMWWMAWVNGFDNGDGMALARYWPEPYRLIQNRGRGLMIQGTRDWTDYQFNAMLTPHMCSACGIGARVQGMQRYYALLLVAGNRLRLVKTLDGDTTLAETDFTWNFGESYSLGLQIAGNRLIGSVNGQTLIDVEDIDRPFTGGAVALICEEGRAAADYVTVQPVGS